MNRWFMYYKADSPRSGIGVKTAPVEMIGDEVKIPSKSDWTDHGTILTEGSGWDKRFYGALSPCTVIKKNGTYFLYYIGAEGDRSSDGGPRRRALGVATSNDGINFTKRGRVLTYLPHNNEEEGIFSAGAFLDDNGEIVMYYSALDAGSATSTLVDSDVRLAVSSDGLNFTDKGDVLSHANSKVWGYGDELFPVGTFREGNRWYLYYIAKGHGAYWDLGLAQGSSRTNIHGNTQHVLTSTVKGGCDPMRLSASKIALFVSEESAGVRVRTGSVSSPESLSSPVETYPFVLVAMYLDIVGPPPLPPPPLEEDHGGADWIISADANIAGKHTNVGTFKVNPGVTAIVQPYDGALYGTLEVQAAHIDIGGNIIASGKGYGGGGGGGGGGGDGYNDGAGGGGGPGRAGGASGGNGGIGKSGGGLGGVGGIGGGPCGGSGAGGRGGYAIPGGQGDSTTDESLKMGSAGGGNRGGRGGSYYKGGGGGGGGAGNPGGGWIKLYAHYSINISGNIQAKGLDNSAGNGADGIEGSKNYHINGGRGGNGGNAASAGGSNGGAGKSNPEAELGMPGSLGQSGGEGGHGAGGGVLLKCAIDSAISITGTIDNRGGGNSPDNGGTVKIFYAVTAPSITKIYTGRLYTKSIPAIPTIEDITCPTCESALRVSWSLVPEENVDLACPLCEAPIGTGMGVEILEEGPIFQQLRDEIVVLDTAIADLKARIEAIGAEIDAIKEQMGL